MLTEVCRYLRNWFERDKLAGDFAIADGVLTYADGTALPLIQGQYYRVIGSLFNDGVRQYGTKDVTEGGATTTQPIDPLTDEPDFAGIVWPMAVPPSVVALTAEIEQWTADNAAVLASPYQSESFGNYSYSLRGGADSAAGDAAATWQSQFSARLAPWRKL